jgi:hypothetical protein
VPADELFDTIEQLSWKEALRPAYERDSFRWLITEAAGARSAGILRLSMVCCNEGTPCGWFVYWAKPNGPASLLQLGVRRRDQFDGVFLALLQDATEQGCSCVKGQAMPKYLVNLTNLRCLFRQPQTSVLVHSRDSDLLNVIHRGDAALSRLDGEAWLRFSGEDWG